MGKLNTFVQDNRSNLDHKSTSEFCLNRKSHTSIFGKKKVFKYLLSLKKMKECTKVVQIFVA